jgi:PHD/YefM family antitoxin component YafN of YafNO toxin-antitoxin module
MKISKSAIVSNTEIIKNYKKHRDLAEGLGSIIIFKNNRPDAVLFSIKEYDRISAILEAFDSLNEEEVSHVLEFIRKEKTKDIIPSLMDLSIKKE